MTVYMNPQLKEIANEKDIFTHMSGNVYGSQSGYGIGSCTGQSYAGYSCVGTGYAD